MEGFNRVTEGDYQKARVLCGQFLTGNWSQTSKINATILTGGFINFIFLCELPAELQKDQPKPHQVVVRISTGLNQFNFSGEVGETFSMQAVAKAGLGPELYGVFPGGRVEEYIATRRLVRADYQDKNVITSVAKAMAKFHCLDVPLRKSPNAWAGDCRAYIEKCLEVRKKIDYSKFRLEIRTKLETVFEIDWLAEFDWCMELMSNVKSRVVFSHLDLYVNNLMTRSKEGNAGMAEDDVVIIDMEMVAYFYRGYDVGTFLEEAAYDVSDTSNPLTFSYLSDDVERHFVREYLARWRELNPDKFDPEIDNEDNLMLEQKILGLMTTMVNSTYAIGQTAVDPSFAETNFVDWCRDRIQIETERKDWIKKAISLT